MSPRLGRIGLRLVLPIVLLLAWSLLAAGPSIYFPPVTVIAERFVENWFGERLISELWPSVRRLGTAWLLASAIGIIAGLVLGSSHRLRQVLDPLINFIRSIPSAALIPFALLAFGIGDAGKIFVITFVCVWPILLNTMDGVDEIDETMRHTERAFQISRFNRVVRAHLPFALPRISTGMRTSLGLAVIVMLISEMFASTNGIGYFTIQAQRTFRIADMWSGVVMLALLGYLLNAVYAALDRRILSWHHERGSIT